jgi:poly(hydroxyalkanoate) depolymerase family esterase
MLVCCAAANDLGFGMTPETIDPRWRQAERFTRRGRLRSAPWVRPARDYLLYVPQASAHPKPQALVVMAHGCKQSPEQLAATTGIAALAEKRGWIVLLPRQDDKANSHGCWNWFDGATADGNGETAIVAEQVRAVKRAHRIAKGRVFAAGHSAGGALAAALGLRHPDLFAGVFVHSGLACGAAISPASAMRVMREGPEVNVEEIGHGARTRAGGKVRMPLTVVHGDKDDVVTCENAVALVRQYLAFNGLKEGEIAGDALPPPDATTHVALGGGREMRVHEYRDAKGVVVRMVVVPGLAHAWSGGDDAFPFSDARPPSGSRLLAESIAGWASCRSRSARAG